KNVAFVAALALWALGMLISRVLSVVIFAAYVILTVLSFMAFFGFMSTVQHQLETDALHASTQYQSLRASANRAQDNVEQLSIYADTQAVQDAKQQLQRLAPQITAAEAAVAQWVHPDGTIKTNNRGLPFTTKAREAQSQLATIQAQAKPYDEVINGYARYQAALAHQDQTLKDLAALSPTQVSTNSNLHPMFVDLGLLVSAAPDAMKVAFMFISSASAEILGTLSILIAILLGKQRSMTLDEVQALTAQLQAQHQHMQTVFGQPTQLSIPDSEPTQLGSPYPKPTLVAEQVIPTQPSTPTLKPKVTLKRKTRSVDEWVTHLSQDPNWNPAASIERYKTLGMGQDKAQQVKAQLLATKQPIAA
ncbi:MAG: hypothetical protein AAGJ35_03305, partial [Myxococcota bacterium]